jgi:hypothetical protein
VIVHAQAISSIAFGIGDRLTVIDRAVGAGAEAGESGPPPLGRQAAVSSKAERRRRIDPYFGLRERLNSTAPVTQWNR